MNIKRNVLAQIVTEKFFRPDWVSNSRPSGSESGALPTELCGRTNVTFLGVLLKLNGYCTGTDTMLGHYVLMRVLMLLLIDSKLLP